MAIVTSIEDRSREIGRAIFGRVREPGHGLLHQDLDSRLMEWSMKDEKLKTQLFRFVDVLPTLLTPEEIVRHLQEYLGGDGNLPHIAQWGIGLASHGGIAARAVAATVEHQVGAMARRFIAGSNISEAAAVVREQRKRGMAFTLDILGEVAVSEDEAQSYQRQYLDLIQGMAEEAKSWKPVPSIDSSPRVNVSVKLSSLYSQIEPADPIGSAEAIKSRLRPILELARSVRAFIHVDMEHYAVKGLTLKVFREILMEPEFRDSANYGITIQAYLRDSESDLRELIEWTKDRGTPVTVRLVRGAYWDYETVIARQRGWPVRVFTHKPETDLSYERLTEMLIDSHPVIATAVGTHNIRSVAHAMALTEARGLPKGTVEYQMLYGMGNPLKQAIVDTGERLRVYTPYGELIPGMSYLVRRLLENTSNESFLRQGFSDGVSVDDLLRNPFEVESPSPVPAENRPFNEPERDFSRSDQRTSFAQALESVRAELGGYYPLVIGGREVRMERQIESIDPSRPSQVVGRVADASAKEARKAVEAARKAFPAWRDAPAVDRAGYLFKAAEIARGERDTLAAWEVFETGKGWREADADVCETIDYLDYYAREMVRLAEPRRLGAIPGETNDYIYEPRGVAAIIPPWNFPMAICAGMASAAIVAGNTAIIKPASQSPVVAAKFVDVLRRAGLPDGVVNFVPGPGDVVGEYMVTSPDVDIIAFTGSRAVGTRIFRLASEVQPGQDHLKKVIAEMGGKNALIIDSDADLDEAVTGAIASSFGYQGQKCSASSRIIVLDSIYDRFLTRFVAAARSLKIGPADDPGTFIGPVIDRKALERILGYIEIGKTEARLVLETDVSAQGEGYYVGPTIFAYVPPDARIAQDEIFGPVVAVIRARDIGEALKIAMSTQYCLTGGIYSRSPAHIEQARREFRVGNLYINRKITGALVGRQPFGGFKMSGIGSKAGGPDYLLQFLEPRTVTENTMRRGFAPEGAG